MPTKLEDGLQPAIWISRLMGVNETSQFTAEQIAIINAGFMRILQKLEEHDGTYPGVS